MQGVSVLIAWILGAAAPFGLLLLGRALPELLMGWIGIVAEESVKWGLVRQVLAEEESSRWWWFAMIGVMFGGSELVLYTLNVLPTGTAQPLLLRGLLTVPMHAVTPVVMWEMARRGNGWHLLGIAGAIAIHGAFNVWLG